MQARFSMPILFLVRCAHKYCHVMVVVVKDHVCDMLLL